MQDNFHLFTVQIGKLYKQIQRLKTEGMKRYGLKGAHVSILHLMAGNSDGITFQEICSGCDLDRSLVSRELNNLVKTGFVKKESTTGVYNAKYFATEKTKNILPEFMEIINNIQEKAKENISTKEIVVFYHVLEQLEKNLEETQINE